MAPSSARFSILALFLLSFFALWLPTVRADLQIPALSPLELSVELANLDTPHLGPQIQKFHHLLDEVEAPPGTHKHEKRYGSGGSYWFSQIKRQGKVPYGANASFVIWRNVIDYGAKGDGVTDDTYAINNASADGNRCGLGCDSQTTTPAIVFFPPGTYMISALIIQYYYTQFIGDANNLPTIKAMPSFVGIGLFDSDVYLAYGYSWWTNQNNFYRRFATSYLTSPPFRQRKRSIASTGKWHKRRQFGIFMDNGSGGFMEDLIFNGGGVGFFSGNQQFTVRNLTFNRCETGIFQNWNWVFLYKSITFNECGIGLDMSQGGEIPATGSIVLQDSIFNNCQYGVITTFSTNSTPSAAATLVIDNVLFTQTDPAVQYPNGTSLLTGNQRVVNWVQGWFYTAYEATIKEHNLTCWEPTADYVRTQEPLGAAPKSASLLDANGNVWERSRPQYEGVPMENFISIITVGKCAGDGITDDTQCMQNFFNSIKPGQIAYIDHGAYLVRNTVQIPNDIKIQGEIWPLFMVDGSSPIFQNMKKPVPAFRVGNPGDVGTTEIVEIVFETRGPAPGAIMIEWNLAGVTPTSTGMWDTHWRIGGSNGTLLQSDKCTKNPTVQHNSNHACIGSFLLLHVTRSGSLLMSNNWGWVSDHELDLFDHNQIDIYNGRGALIESQGPVMMYGTAFEHSMLYNYNVANAKAIYMGVIQSETMQVPDHSDPYAQDNPNSLDPFAPNSVYSDPTFAECSIIAICYKTYGLYLFNSTYIFIYGAGLYSFFNNYDQGCLLTENCQEYSVGMAQSEGIYIYALSTKAASVMVEIDQVAVVPQARSPNGFCQTVALFEYP
ncbi:hypothetical protein B0A54_01680 [Friedmanniomyces endolithicus]|uniref:Rhamnogalacturonase A/B/Epimerase-like pectate lyase domain-containing protein n=1 Tax=Friedmanniomyces endolithicus TaxID=329885 RepID=A0A4U0VG70_9PEZI|nr:hypothetical protein B0A54_01680 [Friedmanniomyces endolithicus]